MTAKWKALDSRKKVMMGVSFMIQNIAAIVRKWMMMRVVMVWRRISRLHRKALEELKVFKIRLMAEMKLNLNMVNPMTWIHVLR